MSIKIESANELRAGDVIEVVRTDKDFTHRRTFTWGGYDPVYMVERSQAGVQVDIAWGREEVYLVDRQGKEWPESGAPILVLEVEDPLGEAGLPEAPFIAVVSGHGFLQTFERQRYRHKSFAKEWRELTVEMRNGIPGVGVSYW